MEKKENKASAILMNIDIVVASIILAILIVLTFLGVVWRYIFNAPFTWLEEVQTSCMVWIVFAGAGAAFRSGNHVAIDRDDRGPDAEEHAEDHGNPDFHRSCSRNRISVHAEYRFHPGVRKERTFHKYVKNSVFLGIRYRDRILFRYDHQLFLRPVPRRKI